MRPCGKTKNSNHWLLNSRRVDICFYAATLIWIAVHGR
jgi:hypothetical protein